MTTGSLFWLVLFGVAALLFFGIALVVTVRGVGDIRDLLGFSKRRSRKPS